MNFTTLHYIYFFLIERQLKIKNNIPLLSKACIPSREFEKTIKMSVAATNFIDERLLIILTSVPLCCYHHGWQVLKKLIKLNNKFFIIYKCFLFLTVTKCRYEICLILQALTEHINRFVSVIIGGEVKKIFYLIFDIERGSTNLM